MQIHSTRNLQESSFYDNMDILIDENTSAEDLKKCFTVSVKSEWSSNLPIFIDKLLPSLSQPINLVITGTDQTFPNNTDLRPWLGKYPQCVNSLFQHPFVNKIFAENLDCASPKTFPIPLGVTGSIAPEYYIKHENINPEKPLKLTNFNMVRYNSLQWAERQFVKILCESFWVDHYIEQHNNQFFTQHGVRTRLTHESYLKILSEYMFTVCVHGGGLDVNPKLWEALLVGTIPIIRENKPYTDIYIDLDLPVVIVKDWSNSTINLENLTNWCGMYYHHFTDPDKRQDMLYKLSADHWINYIKQ